MKKLFCAIALILTSINIASAEVVYVTNRATFFLDDTVSVIDTDTNTVFTTISVGENPEGIAVTPDGSTVYVVNSGDNNVTPINTFTNIAGTNISVGAEPSSIAITPDGAKAYVTNRNILFGNSVSVIDLATNTVSTTINLPANSAPDGVAITPDGTTAYVANGFNVTTIDVATDTIGTTIPLVAGGAGIAITPDGTTAYVVTGNNLVTPIDIATNTAGSTITVGSSPFQLAISPDGTTVYVPNRGSDNVSRIDTATNTTLSSISVGDAPNGVIFFADGKKAYVSNTGDDNISIINVQTATVSAGTISVGDFPFSFAIAPTLATISGACKSDEYPTQTDLVNVISLTNPSVSFVRYFIYSDFALTNLLGTIPVNSEFEDHQQSSGSFKDYYITGETEENNQVRVGSIRIFCP